MRRLALVLLVVTAATPAAAQERNAPIALQLPGSTRALGLGNAYPLASADNDALFHHPGLLDGARGIGASLAFYGRATLASFSAGTDWWNGGVAVGIQSLSYSAADAASGAFAAGEAGLGTAGGFDASELVVSAGYGRVIKGFRVGIVGKMIEQRMPDERDVTIAADLGVARRFGFVTAGFAAQNLGRQPEIDGQDVDLPLTFTLGASTLARPTGPLDVALSAAVGYREDETITASAGLEVGYWPVNGRTFIGRIGVRYIEDSDVKPLTLGAGFVGDRIGLDYAIQDFDTARPVHRVGVRWR